MLIVLFVLNKELRSVAVCVIGNDGYSFPQGNNNYMESSDTAVVRIAKEQLGIELDKDRVKFVRKESSTVANGKTCTINSIMTYLYEIHDGEISLDDSDYSWVEVSRVIDELVDCNKYFEAAYLGEVCEVV